MSVRRNRLEEDWSGVFACVNFACMYTRDLMSLLAIVVGMLLVLVAG